MGHYFFTAESTEFAEKFKISAFSAISAVKKDFKSSKYYRPERKRRLTGERLVR